MTVLRIILAELIGLFIDDRSLAVAAVIWIVVLGTAVHLGLPPLAAPVLLVVGLAAILAENVRRSARALRRSL